MERILVTSAIAIALGIVSGRQFEGIPFLFPALAILAAGGWGFTARRRPFAARHLRVVMACLLCFSLGHWRYHRQIVAEAKSPMHQLLSGVEQTGTIHIRGVVAAEPEIRGRSTVSLCVRVEEYRLAENEEWATLEKPEKIELRVFTRAGGGREGRIDVDLAELTTPTAYGSRIEAEARYRPLPDPERINGFDLGEHLLRQGLSGRVRAYWTRVEVLETGCGHPVIAMILAGKQRILGVFDQHLSDSVRRLAGGAILGERGGIRTGSFRDRPITDLFDRAGIGHVLAVSGLHVGLIGAGMVSMLRLFRVRKALVPPCVAVLLLVYLVMTGARPATTRAVIMGVISLAVYTYGIRPLQRAAWTGMAISALGMLTLNPRLLFAPGFQLSFGAVLSLLMLTGPIERRLERLAGAWLLAAASWVAATLWTASAHMKWLLSPTGTILLLGSGFVLFGPRPRGLRASAAAPGSMLSRISFRRIPKPIRVLLAAQGAIQLGVMIPLSACYFGRYSVAGCLVNLAAIPLIGIFVQVGMLMGVVGCLPVVGPWLAAVMAVPTEILGTAFLYLADAGASWFRYPRVPKPDTWQLAVYYAVVLFMANRASSRHRADAVGCRWLEPLLGNRPERLRADL